MSATTSSSAPERGPAAADWRAALRRPGTAVGVMCVLALLAALWAGRAFVIAVVMATTLAVLLRPAVVRVQRVLRIRALAALVVLSAATATTAGLGGVVAAQFSASAQRMPDMLRLAARDVATLGSAGASTVRRTRSALEELDRSVARVTGTPRGMTGKAVQQGSIVADAVETSTEWLGGLMRFAADLLLQAGVIVMLTFFLLCSGESLAGRISAWCDDRPRVRGRVAPLVADVAREMRHYGRVTLITNGVIGVVVALGLAAFGVSQPWLWGLLAGALHFIPYAGLAILMVLAAAEVYVLHGAWGAALGAMVFVAAVGVIVGTALAAWLQGRASRIDSALVFGGTVFFSVLWGGWGLVLGPLLVVALRVVIHHARALPATPAAAAAPPLLAAAAAQAATAGIAGGDPDPTGPQRAPSA